MSIYKIQLLGGFNLIYGDKQMSALPAARHQSLLAYLLFNRHTPQLREHVAFIFWPESLETQALNNLRKALHHIRKQLPNANQRLRHDPLSEQVHRHLGTAHQRVQ